MTFPDCCCFLGDGSVVTTLPLTPWGLGAERSMRASRTSI